jgi:hypothetical protein
MNIFPLAQLIVFKFFVSNDSASQVLDFCRGLGTASMKRTSVYQESSLQTHKGEKNASV